MHQLEAGSIHLEFGERRILSSIYLTLETGKITGLLGRNGQGKTCLMNIIYGTMDCEKSIRLNSTTYNALYKRPDLLGYLPQFNFIPRTLTLKRIFRDFDLTFDLFIKRFPEFESRYHSPISELSGGGQRLVELYIIAKRPACFVMFDEPFTHLIPFHIEMVKDFLMEEKQYKGFLITDHMYRQVLDTCDDLYILSDGITYLTNSTADIEGYARMEA